VELISYEGVTVDPAPQTEHLGYDVDTLSPQIVGRLRLGPKSPGDLIKGRDLRPRRLPHRT
jgi:hypothetical protein